MERTDRDLDRLNGYSKTMMIQKDRGAQQTKQIVAEMIEPGGRTIDYEIYELINSIWTNKGGKASTVERVDQCPYLTRSVKATVQSLLRHHHYQLPIKFYSTSFSQLSFHLKITLLWVICVDTDITGQLLIIYCAFFIYLKNK